MASPDIATLKRPSGSWFIALGVIAVLVAVLFFVAYAINRATTLKFEYEGHDVAAQVEALKHVSHILIPYVDYQYTDEQGTVHHASDIYPFSDVKDLKVGQAIGVVYLSRAPDSSRIARHQDNAMKALNESPWGKIGIITLGGLFCISLGMWRKGR